MRCPHCHKEISADVEIIDLGLKFDYLVHDLKDVEYIIFHHSATSANTTVEEIHKMHKDRTWAGIGYNLAITPDGKCYLGRGLKKQGAHCLGMNSKSIGVVVIGNFEKHPVTKEQYTTCVNLAHYFKSKNKDVIIEGHKTFNKTLCPGAMFPLAELKKLNEKET